LNELNGFKLRAEKAEADLAAARTNECNCKESG